MTCYLQYSYMQTHNLLYRIISIVFGSPCNVVFITTFKHMSSALFLFCVTVCAYARTRAESVDSCMAILITFSIHIPGQIAHQFYIVHI